MPGADYGACLSRRPRHDPKAIGTVSGLSALARTAGIPAGAGPHHAGGGAPPAGAAHDAPGPDGGHRGQ